MSIKMRRALGYAQLAAIALAPFLLWCGPRVATGEYRSFAPIMLTGAGLISLAVLAIIAFLARRSPQEDPTQLGWISMDRAQAEFVAYDLNTMPRSQIRAIKAHNAAMAAKTGHENSADSSSFGSDRYLDTVIQKEPAHCRLETYI